MNRFEYWQRDSLEKFCHDCNEKLKDQERDIARLEEEIVDLTQDLQTVLNAYRKLVVEHAGKTD